MVFFVWFVEFRAIFLHVAKFFASKTADFVFVEWLSGHSRALHDQTSVKLSKGPSRFEASSVCLELPTMICGEGPTIRLVKTSAMCKISSIITSFKSSSRLSYKRLNRFSGRFTIQVQSIQSLCKVRQLFLQSPFRRGFGSFSGGGVDEGERGRSSLGRSGGYGHHILRFLGIYVLEHGHDHIQVVMSIQGAI